MSYIGLTGPYYLCIYTNSRTPSRKGYNRVAYNVKQDPITVEVTYKLDISGHEVFQIMQIMSEKMPNIQARPDQLVLALCIGYLREANKFYERRHNQSVNRTEVQVSLEHVVKEFLDQYHKLCAECGEDKSRTEFSPRKPAGDGLSSYCKACHRNKYYKYEKKRKE